MDKKNNKLDVTSISRAYNIDDKGVYSTKAFCSSNSSQQRSRIVYISEDLLLKIYDDTTLYMGQKRAEIIWHNIGHKTGVRALTCSSKYESLEEIGLESILESFSRYLFFSRIKIFDKYEINKEKGEIYLKALDSVFMRKRSAPPLYIGAVKGIFEELYGTEQLVEEIYYPEEDEYKIIIKNTSKPIMKKSEKVVMSEVYNKNFKNMSASHDLPTLIDLIKFKKIELHETKHILLGGSAMIPLEIGLLEIIYDIYKILGYSTFLENSIVSTLKSIIKNYSDIVGVEKKVKEAKCMLFALGFGKVDLMKKDNLIFVKMHHPAYTRFGDGFFRTIIRATMEAAFNVNLGVARNTRDKIIFEII
ncbi:MAG: hypothetical protein PF542_02405 [Nanoarchaeota archaeon]|jgi:hypothetical protein|nr:hypothetical protein [Nanoarchaeota archaeon]